jgi:AraC family transcriptional activator of pobA
MTEQKRPDTDIPTYKLFEGASEWPIKDMVHHELIQTRVKGHEGKIRTHRHLDLFHVFYLSQGSARTVLDGEQTSVHGPLVVTVPPLCIHGIAPLEELRGHLLTLPGSSVRYLLRNAETDADLTETPCIIQGMSKEQIFEMDYLFRNIEQEARNSANSRFMAMQSLLRLVFVWIIRRSLESKARVPVANDRSATRIRRFKSLIEENFTRSLSIKEYANHMGISTAQLNNICRAKVGKSALQIVHERLTLEIKRNLVYTSLTVSEIAYELGFSDPAYLTRFFSKQTGLSPKQYRSGARPTMPEFVEAPDIKPETLHT